MTDIIQQSEEWFQVRCGKVTASRISDIMAKTKSGYSTSRKNYMAQLVAERLTGKPQETYQNQAMLRGIETEKFAVTRYEKDMNELTETVGFVFHPTIQNSGASPDRLVGEKGLVEVKCPNTATHIEYVLGGTIPKDYILQMAFQLACTGREWCDFVSYDDRLSENLQILRIRYNRDDKLIAEIESEVKLFLSELDELVEKLKKVGEK